MSQTLEKTLQIAGIGIIGVFIFMTLFYLLILAIDKIFPYKEETNAKEDSVKERTQNKIQT
jgi:Na+-transporting methylmalonyl-CoA/oxaloacetate decarboxylase gamma subunit